MFGNCRGLAYLRRASLGGALVLALSGPTWADDLVKSQGNWTVSGTLDADESEEISGLRCVAASPRPTCLMVADETRFARRMELDGSMLIVGDKVDLLLPTAKKEADAEGVDIDLGFYYVTGSHGLSKGGNHQPTRYFVFRIAADVGSGELGKVEASDRLLAALQMLPELKDFVNRRIEAGDAPREHGLNIEGLAVRDGQAFFGLRGPVQGDMAYVVRVPVAVLFGAEAASAELFPVRLGNGQGIRDMAKVEGGMLLLSGPEAETAGHAAVFFWDGSSDAPRRLAGLDLGTAVEMKPEALLILPEAGDAYRILIMSDSAAQGQPREYRIPKPATM